MTGQRWYEVGRIWEEDQGLLDDEQVAQCQRSDLTEPRWPVPTRMVSNGEYMPAPQTQQQKQVESRLAELADGTSRELGISRRQFLAGSGGMAAALLAMNEVTASCSAPTRCGTAPPSGRSRLSGGSRFPRRCARSTAIPSLLWQPNGRSSGLTRSSLHVTIRLPSPAV